MLECLKVVKKEHLNLVALPYEYETIKKSYRIQSMIDNAFLRLNYLINSLTNWVHYQVQVPTTPTTKKKQSR